MNDDNQPHEDDVQAVPSDEPSDVEHTLRLPADQEAPGGEADVEHTRPFEQQAPGQQQAAGPAQAAPAQGQSPQGQAPQDRWAPPSGAEQATGASSFAPPAHQAAHPQQPTHGPAGQPGYGQAPPPYAGYGAVRSAGAPPAHTGAPRAKVSRGIWPAVAALSLLIGLVGGAAGGAAWTKWQDEHDEPGRTSGGLADVDTVSTAPLPADNGSIAAVAEELLPSTVQIIADANGEEGGATGSGFFLDKQGHVVTNNHVVEGAADGGKIMIVDHEGKRHDATVVGRSPVYDLAVLYVKGLGDIQPASLGASKQLRVGENVVAIGSPLGLSSTVTAGIVSALDRPVTTGGNEDSQSYINAVQTDAAINPGNSGGPLVNLAGQVVGVNSAIATTGGSLGGESGNIGVGFAIPIEQVKVTADQILKDGEARYPVIGATVSSDGTGDGAHIQDVEKGSPAADGGLEKGDVVTALDDRAVSDSPTLIVAIRSHLPGETVTLTVDRDGKEQEIKVTLDSKVG